MRKIIMFNLVSLDGFFAGPKDDITWHNADDEFNKYAITLIKTFDTILFGRKTYKLFEGFWPNAADYPETTKEDLIIADKINVMNKIVFSKTLKKVSWQNSRLLHRIDPKETAQWKRQKGLNMVIYGSGTIVQQLTDLGLVDEYQVLVNPIILGKGKPLFKDVHQRQLRLIGIRAFRSGNVLLSYQPAKK